MAPFRIILILGMFTLVMCSLTLFYNYYGYGYTHNVTENSVNSDNTAPITELSGHLNNIVPINEVPDEKRMYIFRNNSKYRDSLEFEPNTFNISHLHHRHNRVMYYHCNMTRFTYANYLSVMSVIWSLFPYSIVIYNNSTTRLEGEVWLGRIRSLYPYLEQEIIPCPARTTDQMRHIQGLLRLRGGLYVHENTLLTSNTRQHMVNQQGRPASSLNAFNNSAGGFILMSRNARGNYALNPVPNQTVFCDEQYSRNTDSTCLVVADDLAPETIQPHHECHLSRLLRWLSNADDLTVTGHNSQTLAPNIAHYVLVNMGTSVVEYMMYLSVLSVLYLGQVDHVYLHGARPSGPLWETLNGTGRVHHVAHDDNTRVFGIRVDDMRHVSDIVRIDVLLRYGGLYLDRDTLMVNPLPLELRSQATAMSPEGKPLQNLQNGVILSKPGAKFLVEYVKTWKVYREDLWSWNSCYYPTAIRGLYPTSIHVSDRLQMSCPYPRCFPAWLNRSVAENLNYTQIITDWRTSAIVYHFPGSKPREVVSPEAYKTSESIFGEMVRLVLEAASQQHIDLEPTTPKPAVFKELIKDIYMHM